MLFPKSYAVLLLSAVGLASAVTLTPQHEVASFEASANQTLSVPAEPHRIDYARGDGSREVARFQTSGPSADRIRFFGYGLVNGLPPASGGLVLSGFEDLLPHIRQEGGDVLIVLDKADVVRLRNVRLEDLSADNFQFRDMLEGPMTIHAADGWYVFNNSWGAADLVYGRNFWMKSSYTPGDVTNEARFIWEYPPTRPTGQKVYAYPSLMFGTDIYDNAPGTHYDNPALPVRVSDLESMVSRYAVTFGGDVGGFDVSYDFWLTSRPDGKRDQITNEVMVWLHRGEVPPYGTLVGRYEEGAYKAEIYHIDHYTALIPSRDYPAGAIDMRKVLRRLQALGIVSDREYLVQIDLGAEPIRGRGYLQINRLSYDIVARYPADGLQHYEVDGRSTRKLPPVEQEKVAP